MTPLLVPAKSQKERKRLYYFRSHLRPGELSLWKVRKKKLLCYLKLSGKVVVSESVQKPQWGRPSEEGPVRKAH